MNAHAGSGVRTSFVTAWACGTAEGTGRHPAQEAVKRETVQDKVRVVTMVGSEK